MKNRKVAEILADLRADGWHVARQRGSHRQLNHPVNGHPNEDLAGRTLRSIYEQAELPVP